MLQGVIHYRSAYFVTNDMCSYDNCPVAKQINLEENKMKLNSHFTESIVNQVDNFTKFLLQSCLQKCSQDEPTIEDVLAVISTCNLRYSDLAGQIEPLFPLVQWMKQEFGLRLGPSKDILPFGGTPLSTFHKRRQRDAIKRAKDKNLVDVDIFWNFSARMPKLTDTQKNAWKKLDYLDTTHGVHPPKAVKSLRIDELRKLVAGLQSINAALTPELKEMYDVEYEKLKSRLKEWEERDVTSNSGKPCQTKCEYKRWGLGPWKSCGCETDTGDYCDDTERARTSTPRQWEKATPRASLGLS